MKDPFALYTSCIVGGVGTLGRSPGPRLRLSVPKLPKSEISISLHSQQYNMHIYTHICMYLFIYMYPCVDIYIYVSISLSLFLSLFVSLFAWLAGSLCICLCLYLYLHMSVRMPICICQNFFISSYIMCIYIYTYCTYIYSCVYICMRTYWPGLWSLCIVAPGWGSQSNTPWSRNPLNPEPYTAPQEMLSLNPYTMKVCLLSV